VAALARERFNFKASEQHFLVFGVPGQTELNDLLTYTSDRYISTCIFNEPDFGETGENTALAVIPLRKSILQKHELWNKYNLLTMD